MYNILHDVYIQATKASIFKAITDPQGLNNWWTLKCSGIPKEGEEYNFYFTPEYDWYGKVTKCVKDKSFHIAMTRSSEGWEETSFGFDLMDVKDGVRVMFWHHGWPECDHHFRRSSYCWAMLLNGLKNYVERGVIVPFEERE